MHMADALISPVVGITMLVATSAVAGYSIKKVKNEINEQKIPLMGVMGAFIFACQMINFAIPATGSSGHIGGGLLLAIFLGPYAGFLTILSVLLIQALFFADGGLLAFGCNVFNMGFYTCFIAYPLIYKNIINKSYTKPRIFIGSLLAAIVGLQLGAFSVVLETFFSAKTELSFINFVMLMQPIHLAISIVEGLITATIVIFIYSIKPEILENKAKEKRPTKNVIIIFIIMVIVIGGFVSLFASSNPDGLEWSINKVTGQEELEVNDELYNSLAEVQENTAILPNYSFKGIEQGESLSVDNLGNSVSGIVGGALTLFLVVIIGLLIRLFKKKKIDLE